MRLTDSVENMYTVQSLINKTRSGTLNGMILFSDDKHDLAVDTLNGMVYKVSEDDGTLTPYGRKEDKKNGYKYVPIYIGERKIDFGIHTIIGMLTWPGVFEHIEANGKTPVINHKDNCPWHNNQDNLEWITMNDNRLHGLFVNYIVNHSDPIVSCRGYNGKNNKRADFKCLHEGISVSYIKNFMISCKIKEIKKSNMTEDIAYQFVNWYDKNRALGLECTMHNGIEAMFCYRKH